MIAKSFGAISAFSSVFIIVIIIIMWFWFLYLALRADQLRKLSFPADRREMFWFFFIQTHSLLFLSFPFLSPLCNVPVVNPCECDFECLWPCQYYTSAYCMEYAYRNLLT
jgi:hypothetical protein